MIKKQESRYLLLYSFFFAVAAILITGYQFNNGDQEEHLPYVYRILDPDLYQNDYLVPLQTSQFTVRFYFAWIIAFLGKIISVEYAVFLVHFGCLMAMNYAVTSMVLRRTDSKWAMIITPALILGLNNIPLGGNGLLDVQLTCSMPALAIGLFAMNEFDKGNLVKSCLLAGLAALFQVLIGLQLAVLVVLGSLFIPKDNSLKSAIKGIITFSLASAPMFIPIFYRQFFNQIPYDKDLYFNILFLFRNAHHYAPQCFPVSRYLLTGFFFLIVWFLLRRSDLEKTNKNFRYLILLVVLGCITYSIGFMVFKSEAVAKTQWFKSILWAFFSGIVLLSSYFSNKMKTEKYIPAITIAGMLTAVGCLLLIFNSGYLPMEKMRHRYKIGNYHREELQVMHEWIRNNIPASSVILTFPGDDSFLCEAQRSSLIGFKAIIHEPEFIFSWYGKIQKYYGISISDFHCGANMSIVADSSYNTLRYDHFKQAELPDYRLMKIDHKTMPDITGYGQVVKQIGNYILLKTK